MIIEALQERGPQLSTAMAEYLVKRHNLKPEAARQRISRSPPQVKRLMHLPFPRKARFLYLQETFASPLYWKSLFAAIYETKGAYARALGAVEARGILPIEHFNIACGAPRAQKKHMSATTLLERLERAGVLIKEDIPGLGICVMTKRTYDAHAQDFAGITAQLKARLIAENILLSSVKEWVRRLGIAGFNQVKLRSDSDSAPLVGTFAWDMTAPSYLSALVYKDKKIVKPGLIVCDVLLNGEAKLHHIEPYLYKVSSLKALKNIGNTIFIFVAQHYDKKAFEALKDSGVIPATPESLFGTDISEAFNELIGTLTRAARGVVDPVKFDELITKLSKLEGAVANMRGAFFELLVAEVVRKTSPAQIEVNKICKGDDGLAEVDVWAVKEGIVARIIECKGYAPGAIIPDEEIDLWLTTRILRVRQYLTKVLNFKAPKPIFELWTSGVLSTAAKERIEKTKIANARKFDLRILCAEEIREATKAVSDKELLKTLEHHFIPVIKKYRKKASK